MIKLIEDPRTRNYFAEADQTHIKAMLAEQFCVILGGPCTYTGKGMKEAHARLAINEGGFNALVEDLQLAMDMHGIPFRAQNKLLAVLAPMHREVDHAALTRDGARRPRNGRIRVPAALRSIVAAYNRPMTLPRPEPITEPRSR